MDTQTFLCAQLAPRSLCDVQEWITEAPLISQTRVQTRVAAEAEAVEVGAAEVGLAVHLCPSVGIHPVCHHLCTGAFLIGHLMADLQQQHHSPFSCVRTNHFTTASFNGQTPTQWPVWPQDHSAASVTHYIKQCLLSR